MIGARNLARSFAAALQGFRSTWKSEHSFRIQIVIGIGVVILMAVFPVNKPEKIILSLLIMAVLVLELLNSTLERIIDALEPRIHPFAREVKDSMAAAVLVAALGAGVIGIIILGPHLLRVAEEILK